MTKSIIEQIAESAKYTAPCPACTRSPGAADTMANQLGPGNNGIRKNGRFAGIRRKSLPVCNFCKGQKVVFTNNICVCAMPALLLDKKEAVWYCGDSACRSVAIGLKYLDTLPHSNAGWYSNGGITPHDVGDFYGH